MSNATVPGLGGSGGYICSYTVIYQIAELSSRPTLLASLAATFGVSGVVGPLIGGLCSHLFDVHLLISL